MKQKVDYEYKSCATCRHWSGPVKYFWPGIVEIDTDDKDQQNAKCNRTYINQDTFMWSSCPNWEPKFKI